MICKDIKLSILFLCTSLNLLVGQECDSGYVWVEDVPISCGGAENCFFEADLNLLQEIIDNSGETINTIMDDNGDGIVQHVELGSTQWINGHLAILDCHLSENVHCDLSGTLPENIGDFTFLEAMWLNGNQLTGEIPESIGNLVNLELLYLSVYSYCFYIFCYIKYLMKQFYYSQMKKSTVHTNLPLFLVLLLGTNREDI